MTRDNNILRGTISALCILGGLLALYLSLRITGFEHDESYQALCIRYYDRQPLALGTFWVGHLWTSLFGSAVISLRYLRAICLFVAIATACIYLWYRVRNGLLAAATFLICCMCANLGTFIIYNWDVGAYPLVSFSVIAFMEFLRRPAVWKAVICGALMGLMALWRLPLVVAPAIWLFMIWRMRADLGKGIFLQYILVPAATMLCTWAAVASLIEGSLTEYISIFSPENFISGHGLKDVDSLIFRFKTLTPILIFSWLNIIAIIFFTIIYIYINPKASIRRYALLTACTVFLAWSFVKLRILINYCEHPAFTICIPIIVALCIIAFWPSLKCLKIYNGKWRTALLILMCYIPLLSVGSDSTTERWCGIFLLPVVVGEVFPLMKPVVKRTLRVFYLTFFIFLSTVLIFKTHHTPTFSTTASEYAGPYCGIMMDKLYIRDLPQLRNDIDSIIGNETYTFFGNARLVYAYIFEETPAIPIQLYHYEDGDLAPLDEGRQTKWLFVTDLERSKPSVTLDSLTLRRGYTIVKETPGYTLLRRPD